MRPPKKPPPKLPPKPPNPPHQAAVILRLNPPLPPPPASPTASLKSFLKNISTLAPPRNLPNLQPQPAKKGNHTGCLFPIFILQIKQWKNRRSQGRQSPSRNRFLPKTAQLSPRPHPFQAAPSESQHAARPFPPDSILRS